MAAIAITLRECFIFIWSIKVSLSCWPATIAAHLQKGAEFATDGYKSTTSGENCAEKTPHLALKRRHSRREKSRVR